MFSGIVAFEARVEGLTKEGDLLTVRIRRPAALKVKVSESVAVNGVCSTVVRLPKGMIEFEYMRETLEHTNLGALGVGDGVNIEPSIALSSRLHGHFVAGHVDTTGVLLDASPDHFRVGIPKAHMRYIVPKGSVAIEGVGLTITGKERDSFTVSLTPYTLEHTNLRFKRVRDRLNIEYDLIVKSIAEIIDDRKNPGAKPAGRHRRKSV